MPEKPTIYKQTIKGMFHSIATSYNRVNRLLSLGQDQRWRKRALGQAQIPPEGRLLDVATGTGDLALMAKQQAPGLRVVGADLTPAMLAQAQEKDATHLVSWMVADGLRLPYSDNTFDAVTSVFMMRNVPDVVQALCEQRRVVKVGGRVVCLEMTWPRRFPMTWLFSAYFFTLPPLVGGLISGNREAYRYLPQSVRRFLTPQGMATAMESAGLRNVTWQSLMLGTVALHVGEKDVIGNQKPEMGD
ncbi:MAG: ubiquinone/menaquinone biosynthesis methyltransferase [Anaerolineae bacterium]|nr:ubiquinone/menaquinone biosynthesis methyltransferase [Anaerolineae bacterium]